MRLMRSLFIAICFLGSMQAIAQTDSTKRKANNMGTNGTEQQMLQQQYDSTMRPKGTGTHYSTSDSLEYNRNGQGSNHQTNDAPARGIDKKDPIKK